MLLPIALTNALANTSVMILTTAVLVTVLILKGFTDRHSDQRIQRINVALTIGMIPLLIMFSLIVTAAVLQALLAT